MGIFSLEKPFSLRIRCDDFHVSCITAACVALEARCQREQSRISMSAFIKVDGGRVRGLKNKDDFNEVTVRFVTLATT